MPRDLIILMSRTHSLYIYCDSEESYSLPQDTEVIKSSFTVSLFWSRLGQSHNQNSQQFAEAQSTKRPMINLLIAHMDTFGTTNQRPSQE